MFTYGNKIEEAINTINECLISGYRLWMYDVNSDSQELFKLDENSKIEWLLMNFETEEDK